MKQITLISEKLLSDYLQQASYLAIYKSMKMEIDIYINREIKDYLSEYAKKTGEVFEYEKIVAMECVIAASSNFYDELHTDQCIWTELEKFIIAQTSWSKNFLRLLIHVENAYHITPILLNEYADLWEEHLIEIVINVEGQPEITSKIQGKLYQKSGCDHHRSMAYDYFSTKSNYQKREISPA